jgi:hypothetical protein
LVASTISAPLTAFASDDAARFVLGLSSNCRLCTNFSPFLFSVDACVHQTLGKKSREHCTVHDDRARTTCRRVRKRAVSAVTANVPIRNSGAGVDWGGPRRAFATEGVRGR